MKKPLLVFLVICCLTAGAFAGHWWAWHTYSRFSPSAVDEEIQRAAMIEVKQAGFLAELRLGETNQAIRDMENFMDDQVSALAYLHDNGGLDEKLQKKIERSLSPAKIYHENYPVSGDDAAYINAMLAKAPGRSQQSTCTSSVCRLDDLRLSKLHTITNSP
jgi:hypothetical protein